MTHIIVKDGRVAVSGGRVVTSAGGAPCGGGDACADDLLQQRRFRLNLSRFDISASLEVSTGLGRTNEIELSFPPATIDFGGRNGGVGVGREYNISGGVGSQRSIAADCGRLLVSGGQGRFDFTPTGQIVERFGSTVAVNTIVGLDSMVMNTHSIDIGPDAGTLRLLGISMELFVCRSVNGGDPSIIRRYLEVFTETSEGDAPTLRLTNTNPDFAFWGEIPVRGSLPLSCGDLSFTEAELSGRRYIPSPSASTQDEANLVLAYDEYFQSGFSGSATEPFVGETNSAVRPSGYLDASHTLSVTFSGSISAHPEASGGASVCGDEFVGDCDTPQPTLWPVAVVCGGSASITYDPAQRPQDGVTMVVGGEQYAPVASTSETLPTSGVWSTDPCPGPSGPCAGLVPNDPLCAFPIYRDCPQCVGFDIGDPQPEPDFDVQDDGTIPGLGDMVAEAIRTISMNTILPCGACERRKQVLNRFGERAGRAVIRLLRW